MKNMIPNTSIQQQSEIDHHRKAMEEQMEIAMAEARQRQGIREKVERLLGRTKSKLKLETIHSNQKYNTRFFNEVRNLRTFVDATKQLKRLNVFNDVALLRKLEYLKQYERYTLTEDEKVLEQLVNDKLFFEHQDEDMIPTREQMHEEGYMTINLVGKMPKQRKLTLDPKQYLNSRHLILQTYDQIDKLQHTKDSTYEQMLQSKFLQEPNASPFYSIIDQAMANPQPPKTEKVQGPDTRHQMVEASVNYLKKHYGIDVKNQQQIMAADIHKRYAQNSAKVLAELKKEATRKFKRYHPTETKEEEMSSPLRHIDERKVYRQQIRAHKTFGKVAKSQSQTSVGTKTQSTEEGSRFYFNGRHQSTLNRATGKLIWDIETTQQAFDQERGDQEAIIQELTDDMDMMQRKHAMNTKLSAMGFGSYDPDLNLRRSIKQNMQKAAKGIRSIKILRYY